MVIRLPLTVRYAETDAMGIVHHSSYVVWLEAARVEWLLQAGLPYTEIEAQGLAFSVVELSLKYRTPARFGEVVEVEAWLCEASSRTIRFDYRVWRGDTVLLAGTSRHLCQDKTGKAVRIPESIALLMSKCLNAPN